MATKVELDLTQPSVTVRDLSKELRVSATYIKEHAEELGGIKLNGRWYFFVDYARERLLDIWPY